MSRVTNMSGLFYGAINDDSSLLTPSQRELASEFNGDISEWDVSNVTNMTDMFAYTKNFNKPLLWKNKTSKVKSMKGMFRYSKKFNNDISGWDVSNVTNMKDMFNGAEIFNQNISRWNVSNVTDMNGMFANTTNFNQNLSDWNVSKVTDMGHMFWKAKKFNSPLLWGNKTLNVTNMITMFSYATEFNQDISGWDVSNVTDMNSMFFNATNFNQNLSDWNTIKVKTECDDFSRGSKLTRGNKPKKGGCPF